MLRVAFLFCLFIITQPALYAQDARVHARNTNAWFMYFGNHKFSEKLGLHAELQWRRSDWFSEHQQLLLRTGLDVYFKNSNSRFTIGYAFIRTYPYGDFAVPNAFPEHRTWQQLLASQKLGKINLSHRYRLEQRWIGNANTGEFENGRYENRMRYMAKATINLTSGEKPVFFAAYDEIFVNFGKDVAYNLFDQNRLYGAVGFTLSKSMKLEVGYLYQLVQLRSLDLTTTPKNRIEDNHTLQFGLFVNFPFVAGE